jgi:hypothetical protein
MRVCTSRFVVSPCVFKAEPPPKNWFSQEYLLHKNYCIPRRCQGYTSDNEFTRKRPFFQEKNRLWPFAILLQRHLIVQSPILSHTSVLKSSIITAMLTQGI